MNTIKFDSSNVLENEFATKLKKRVNNYFQDNNISVKANLSMDLKIIILSAIYIIPFILILTVPMSNIVGLVLSVIMGIGVAGVGMGVMHDACHGAYSNKKWVNDLLSGSLYFLGSNVLNWKIQHNVLHHSFTNVSGLDEDINAKGPIRLSKSTPLKSYHKYQYIYAFLFYGLMTFTMMANDFSRLIRYNKEGLVRGQNYNISYEYFKMVIRKLVYLLIIIGLPIWLSNFTWIQVLIGFFLMHWVASIILSFVFQMAHVVEGVDQPSNDVAESTNWYVHQLNTTADFARNSTFLSWYVGGLNYQIEHHLFQNICHVHYKNIAPIVEELALEYGYPYNLKPSFYNALVSHIQMLKELGRP